MPGNTSPGFSFRICSTNSLSRLLIGAREAKLCAFPVVPGFWLDVVPRARWDVAHGMLLHYSSFFCIQRLEQGKRQQTFCKK